MKQGWIWLKNSIASLGKGKGLAPSHLALILLFIGPAISYLALPIEGEYWAGLMPDRFQDRAYNLAFAMDFIGGFLMYVFGRVRLSASKSSGQYKLSLLILPFVVFGVLTSAFVNWRQLIATMGAVAWWEPLIIATIQPGLQLGINVAQAVVEGKFEKVKVATAPAPVAQPLAQPEPVIAQEIVKVPKPERLERLVEMYGSAPKFPQQQAGDMFGVSRQQIGTDLAELEQAGRIRRNGHGVEVL